MEPEWVEPYRGRFDDGWDAYRASVLARQVELGIVPAGTEPAPRDPDVRAWEDLGDDERRMFARQMEVYAGFLTQTDHHVGRVLAFLEEIGELDDTIVIAISDNGPSAEGRPAGTFNELSFFNWIPERAEDNLSRLDSWGGPDTFPHYSWGWAWAGATPFRRWKRETYRGGIADPCIISWPAGISAAGELRHQFLHAIDVVPTLLDVVGIAPPSAIRGVPQRELHGASARATFDDPDAPAPRSTQYFEMFGHRSLHHDGWRAVCPFVGPSFAEAAGAGRVFGITELSSELLEHLDATGWELYHVADDPGETRNLAEAEPQRLQAMIQRWYAEAGRFGVLPLAAASLERFVAPRPTLTGARRRCVFLRDAAPVPFTVAPRVVNRAHSITAEVTIFDDGADGVLLSQGNRHGGYALYVLGGRLHYVHNYLGLERTTVSAAEPLTPGPHTLRFEFEPTGAPEALAGRGTPGTVTLYVDGAPAATGALPVTVPVTFGFVGVSCGYDATDAVDPTCWSAPFRFTGGLSRVTVELDGDPADDASRRRELLGRQ